MKNDAALIEKKRRIEYMDCAKFIGIFLLLGEKGHDGEIYVLGSGHAEPLAAYIEKIREIIAPDAEIRRGAIPYSEKQVMHLEADVSQLVQDTGWKSTTEFKDGIRCIVAKEKIQ